MTVQVLGPIFENKLRTEFPDEDLDPVGQAQRELLELQAAEENLMRLLELERQEAELEAISNYQAGLKTVLDQLEAVLADFKTAWTRAHAGELGPSEFAAETGTLAEGLGQLLQASRVSSQPGYGLLQLELQRSIDLSREALELAGAGALTQDRSALQLCVDLLDEASEALTRAEEALRDLIT